MTTTVPIFDNAATITLPSEFIVGTEDGNSKAQQLKAPGTGRDSVEGKAEEFLFIHVNDPDTQIRGLQNMHDWSDDKVEERLNAYAGILNRALPAFAVAQMATRQTPSGLNGIMQYSYAIGHKDWMGMLLAFPVQEHIGLLIMTCSINHALERNQQFMDIAESVTPSDALAASPDDDQ
ncbi:hypothetical protein [Bifidobacterium bombi]|uniref:hypothetical protein n=1 Tax=Bifidobacterium bombi TaxID=471511 RepID=UPI0005C717C0|nr:hypothetical protein [Bifidobacterium bombi]